MSHSVICSECFNYTKRAILLYWHQKFQQMSSKLQMRQFQTGLLLNYMDYFLGAFEVFKYVWNLLPISLSLLQPDY